jgi:N-acetylglutamate synthase-like GNAT family acetyltransferase
MDILALASKMRQLAVWIDRNCQPAGFIQHCYSGAPFGNCYVSIDPNRQGPYASGNWNRIHLCGTEPGLSPDGLSRLTEQFSDAGVRRFFVWLMDTIRSWLSAAGFSRVSRTGYPTLHRASFEPARFKSELEIREVRPPEIVRARDQLGATMWREYELSAGKEGFFHFMAFDAGRPVAIGALGVFEGLGYLNSAATAESDRKRGAQQALIASRIEKAREVGCSALAVETLTMLEHSLRNLRRAGFQEVFEKEVYEWSA